MDPHGGAKNSHGESREDYEHNGHGRGHVQVRLLNYLELEIPPLLWDREGRSRRTQREAFVGQDWRPWGSGRNADCLDRHRFASQTVEAGTFQKARKHHRARRD